MSSTPRAEDALTKQMIAQLVNSHKYAEGDKPFLVCENMCYANTYILINEFNRSKMFEINKYKIETNGKKPLVVLCTSSQNAGDYIIGSKRPTDRAKGEYGISNYTNFYTVDAQGHVRSLCEYPLMRASIRRDNKGEYEENSTKFGRILGYPISQREYRTIVQSPNIVKSHNSSLGTGVYEYNLNITPNPNRDTNAVKKSLKSLHGRILYQAVCNSDSSDLVSYAEIFDCAGNVMYSGNIEKIHEDWASDKKRTSSPADAQEAPAAQM